MSERDDIFMNALKAANNLEGGSLKQKETPENGLQAAQISVLTLIAIELHEIRGVLELESTRLHEIRNR